MGNTALIGGILGFLISLLAQLFAVIDDSYTFGNIGILGMLSGMIGVIGAHGVKKEKAWYPYLLIGASIAGFISISFLYAVPALLKSIVGVIGLRRSV